MSMFFIWVENTRLSS